jgi:hypothetical protein
MEQVHCTTTTREPWSKGKLVGQKAPFKLKEIWAIRVRLIPIGVTYSVRDLARGRFKRVLSSLAVPLAPMLE